MTITNQEYNKKYYAEHKVTMQAQIKTLSCVLVECTVCKKQIKKGSMSAHKLTKLHNYIASQIVI